MTIAIGDKFSRLIVSEIGLTLFAGKKRPACRCRCECGTERVVLSQSLRTGNTKSCGCLKAEARSALTHGRSRDRGPTYRSWLSMTARCTSRANKRWPRYGGRGIKVCARWSGVDGFVNFAADMGERPVGKSIDRKDNDGNYEPSNCRWSTPAEQNRNNSRNKLSLALIAEIRDPAGRFAGLSLRAIARTLDTCHSNLSAALKGTTWRPAALGLETLWGCP